MFIGGSKAFFDSIEGFTPHDMDLMEFSKSQKAILSVNKITIDKTIFIWRDDRDAIIEFVLNGVKFPSQVCVLLIPEVVEYLNIDMEIWKKAKDILVPLLDDKHKYLGVILDFYIDNGKAELTDEQRLIAYNVYKQARKNNF